jgi:DUF1365 family protein
MNSCLYRGTVRHRRFSPRPHNFDYDLFMVQLDLAELDQVFADRWLWSVERSNVASFRRSDHPGDPATSLDAHVRDLVERETGTRPGGPIRILTQLRYGGYCFNPVSLFYVYDADGLSVETIVADVGNTPWNERHPYVLHAGLDSGSPGKHRYVFAKDFHVSPFQDMDTAYDWRFNDPSDQLAIHMECSREGELFFDTNLTMERREMTGSEMRRVLARYPLMTWKVLYGIYWQAFMLWAKRMPFYTHPSKRDVVGGAT